MVKRLLNPSETHSFFLFGARGTGKTSLIKERFLGDNTLYIDLLRDIEFEALNLEPDSLIGRVAARPGLQRVVIDEVQKVPALLDTVHHLIETHKDLQFILTGSSARKLKRGGANLLAGRAWKYHLYPFLSDELHEDFSLETSLEWGGLPGHFELSSPEDKKEFFRAYTTMYLREEILQEQLVRDLRPFQRFLTVAAQTSGAIVNFSKVGRDIGVAPQTAESYFQILEDTLLGFRLPAFQPSLRKQERTNPKFYLFDIGVVRALLRTIGTPLSPGTYAYGRAFEHFLLSEIIALSSYNRRDDVFSYYATHGGREVDLVIDRGPEGLVFIEIKSTDSVGDDDLKHLAALAKEKSLKDASFYCFSCDPRAVKRGSVLCLYWQDGLERLGLRQTDRTPQEVSGEQ
ncbi:AAA family ATPase [bacterium]|nr:AAA family ATPase [bacterium]